MTLPAGARLGPYEIVDLIGLGGMGEVHRARDTRLARDVAVKILPASMCEDQDRLRRFEQEAWAAGVLNHPNVVAVYDIGTHERMPYVVTELLEGESLRARLAGGPLPVRKSVEYAVQIAHGLAAAHDKGIVHRDLKPENLFVTRDGRVKLLDFGLAKQFRPPLSSASPDGTTGVRYATEPGVVMGTVGYLSPEQARGLAADHRSDIFAMGAVFYEMLSGRQPFRRETPTDTLAAILREDPSPLPDSVPAALQRIVLHCLEKDPDQRFQSATDAAFHLETLSTPTGPSTLDTAPSRARTRGRGAASLGFGLLALGLGLGWGLSLLRAPDPPRYRQLTYQRGFVSSARFAPDGETIVFTAAWQGGPREVYLGRASGTDFRALSLPGAEVLAVSSRDELALALRRRQSGLVRHGTLARVPLAGGQPRELIEDVQWADWSPDGRDLAVARLVQGRSRLEYPVGPVLHQSEGWISDLRVSPSGDRVVFLEHPALDDDRGAVMVVDRGGAARVLSSGWARLGGLDWRGDEVWTAGAREGSHRALYAIAASGRERLVARVPGGFALYDVGQDGRTLVGYGGEQGGVVARGPGAAAERDVSWLDWSKAQDISADGRSFLFHEAGEGTGALTTFLGRTDGGAPVRLAEGESVALSPDGRQALAFVGPARDLTLVPTGAGESRKVTLGALAVDQARFLPDGLRAAVLAREGGGPYRLHVLDLQSGRAQRVSDDEIVGRRIPVSPDGRWVAATGRAGPIRLYPLAGGTPRTVVGTTVEDQPLGWAGPEALLVAQVLAEATGVDRLEIATGDRRPWRTLAPPDPAGIIHVGSQVFSPDGESYVYSYVRARSDLFLVETAR